MRAEFLCVSVWGVASGPGVGLAGCGGALDPPVVCSAGRSGAVVPVLVLLFVALCFVLRGDLLCVFPFVVLFLCFSVLLVLRLPRLRGGGGGRGGTFLDFSLTFFGIFPDQLKNAKVFLIFKGGITSDPANYRPVTILPTVSKMF